jgi:hypothetical protein
VDHLIETRFSGLRLQNPNQVNRILAIPAGVEPACRLIRNQVLIQLTYGTVEGGAGEWSGLEGRAAIGRTTGNARKSWSWRGDDSFKLGRSARPEENAMPRRKAAFGPRNTVLASAIGVIENTRLRTRISNDVWTALREYDEALTDGPQSARRNALSRADQQIEI